SARRCVVRNSADSAPGWGAAAAFWVPAVGHFSRVRGPMRPVLRPRSILFSFAIAAALALSSERALAQAAVITGRVTSDAGVALQGANVFITELTLSVGSNENGQYTINIPPARISGQTVQLRVRSVGFIPPARPTTPG